MRAGSSDRPAARLLPTLGPSRTSGLPQLRLGQRARLEVPPCSAPAAGSSSGAHTCSPFESTNWVLPFHCSAFRPWLAGNA